ncbi:MAG: MoaD/ThiS family protein [candidate division NC10 bacterium]
MPDTASDDRSQQSGAGRTVRLRLLGPLARLAGRRETTCDVQEGATVRDVLIALAARYGPEFASALLRAPGELHTHVRVFVDGADADPHDPVVTGPAAAPEVTVLVMPIFEGGSQ